MDTAYVNALDITSFLHPHYFIRGVKSPTLWPHMHDGASKVDVGRPRNNNVGLYKPLMPFKRKNTLISYL